MGHILARFHADNISKTNTFDTNPQFVDPEAGGSSPPNCTILSSGLSPWREGVVRIGWDSWLGLLVRILRQAQWKAPA
jgi:hypothetical protein